MCRNRGCVAIRKLHVVSGGERVDRTDVRIRWRVRDVDKRTRRALDEQIAVLLKDPRVACFGAEGAPQGRRLLSNGTADRSSRHDGTFPGKARRRKHWPCCRE